MSLHTPTAPLALFIATCAASPVFGQSSPDRTTAIEIARVIVTGVHPGRFS